VQFATYSFMKWTLAPLLGKNASLHLVSASIAGTQCHNLACFDHAGLSKSTTGSTGSKRRPSPSSQPSTPLRSAAGWRWPWPATLALPLRGLLRPSL
jgi:hypothetical protein